MIYRTIGIQLGIWLLLGSFLIRFWGVETAFQASSLVRDDVVASNNECLSQNSSDSEVMVSGSDLIDISTVIQDKHRNFDLNDKTKDVIKSNRADLINLHAINNRFGAVAVTARQSSHAMIPITVKDSDLAMMSITARESDNAMMPITPIQSDLTGMPVTPIQFDLSMMRIAARDSNNAMMSIAASQSSHAVIPIPPIQSDHSVIPMTGGDSSSRCEITLEPQIGYFNGRYNLRGDYLPDNPLRLLAGESVKVSLAFDDPPRQIDINLGSRQVTLFGHPGRIYYEVEFNAPEDYYTLTLSGERLAPSLTMYVEAGFWHDHTLTLIETLTSIEISGHISNLIQIVPAEN